jgi:uncharacterized membrane protein
VDEPAPTTAARVGAVDLPRVAELGELAWRVAVGALTAAVAAFVLVRLNGWPPHEDETLVLFTARGSVHELIETVLSERGGAPLHFLLAWGVTHLGGGLVELRLVSALFGVASVPVVALLARRLTDRTVALAAVAVVGLSWMLLFHAVYGRMYSLFLFTSALSYLALLDALERRDRRGWILWTLAVFACLATHPYGALVLASQGLYVLYAHRLREALPAFVAVALLGIPFWRADLVLGGRFEVGVGGGGVKLGGVGSTLRYLTRVGGDFTVGWALPRTIVLAFAIAGFVLLLRERRRSAVLAACAVAAPVAFFLALRIGSGLASPESRHLIFVLPFFAVCVALPLVRGWRRHRFAPRVIVVLLLSLAALETAWGYHKTPLLYRGEQDGRVEARHAASTWLAATARPDDILFGYDPLFLGAWERNRDFSATVTPRADTKLALNVLDRAPKPLGRGIWVLDASDTNNFAQKLTIELRYPRDAAKFEARAFGPFLVVRSRAPTRTVREYLLQAQAVQHLGQDLLLGDADINLLTVERGLGLRSLAAAGGAR